MRNRVKTTWRDYGSAVSKPITGTKQLSENNLDIITGRQFAGLVLSTYFKKGAGSNYMTGAIGFGQALSPAKLFNPFKAVSVGLNLVQVGIATAVDKIVASVSHGERMRSSPVARGIKGVLVSPFAAANLLVSPFSNLELSPPIARLLGLFRSKSKEETLLKPQGSGEKEIFNALHAAPSAIADTAPVIQKPNHAMNRKLNWEIKQWQKHNIFQNSHSDGETESKQVNIRPSKS